jgi:hypothetical protein
MKILLDHGGDRTSDLWSASPVTPYQLSDEVKSVPVSYILEISLFSFISVYVL